MGRKMPYSYSDTGSCTTGPFLIGMIMTRINYDMLTYLPGDIDTVVGQDILMDEFGKGAFSFVIIEGMDPKDVSSFGKIFPM